MEREVLQLIAAQGAFAILFTYLLFYILKENSKREENYQLIIKKLSNSLPKIEKTILSINNMLKNDRN